METENLTKISEDLFIHLKVYGFSPSHIEKFLRKKLENLFIDSDSEFSAIGHYRPPDIELCKKLSNSFRDLVRNNQNLPK